MHRFACRRRLRAMGRTAYLAIPKLARLELNLFINDEVVIELDTKRKLLVIRAADARRIPPLVDLNQIDMLPPATDRDEPAPAPAAAVDEREREKIPA